MSSGWAVDDDQVVIALRPGDADQMLEFAQNLEVVNPWCRTGNDVHDPS